MEIPTILFSLDISEYLCLEWISAGVKDVKVEFARYMNGSFAENVEYTVEL